MAECVGYAVHLNRIAEADGGGWLAIVDDLEGCVADGETPEDALANAKDAISEWLDEAHRLGRTVPAPGASAHKHLEQRNAAETLTAN